jgi:hypothetical protein
VTCRYEAEPFLIIEGHPLTWVSAKLEKALYQSNSLYYSTISCVDELSGAIVVPVTWIKVVV